MNSTEPSLWPRNTDKASFEKCSPRVRNLQSEMDLLRTEIQRLKSIDIYNCSPMSHTDRASQSRADSAVASHNERTQSRDEVNRKLMQLGLASYKQISDSDTSEHEPVSDVTDFEGFIETLRSEKRPRSHPISSAERSEASCSQDWERERLVSTGTDPMEATCMECTSLQQERFQLMHRLTQTERSLQIQSQRLGDAEEEIERRSRDVEDLRKARSSVRQAGTMTDAFASSVPQERKETREKGIQCERDASAQALEEELKSQRIAVETLEAAHDALLRENESLKAQDLNSRQDRSTEATLYARLDSLLIDIGSSADQRQFLIQEIRDLLATVTDADRSCVELGDAHSPKRQMEDALSVLEQQKDAEIFNLSAEKEVLTRKIMDLRKAVKKETCDREAAEQHVTKLQSDLAAQQSEVEQCRLIAQQKRQQVDALEDTLAIVQHENEQWERDYELLIEKKDQLERQLRIARNLECAQE